MSIPSDASELISVVRQALLAAQGSDGGWPYHPGATASTEPTALAVLALHATGGLEAVGPAADWLAARKRDDGLFSMSATHEDANWTSPLAAMALGLAGRQDAYDRAVAGLLGEPVFTFDARLQPGTYGFDTTIRGWPWRGGDFSFVEPTALAMILLKQAGQGQDPRVREAAAMLHARALAGGGWNYGEPQVLGENLYPTVAPTAAALLALADEQDDTTAAARDWLLGNRGQIGALMSLAWAAIALNVLDLLDDNWRTDLVNVWNALPDERRGPMETALTLLALAGRQNHPLAVV